MFCFAESSHGHPLWAPPPSETTQKHILLHTHSRAAGSGSLGDSRVVSEWVSAASSSLCQEQKGKEDRGLSSSASCNLCTTAARLSTRRPHWSMPSAQGMIYISHRYLVFCSCSWSLTCIQSLIICLRWSEGVFIQMGHICCILNRSLKQNNKDNPFTNMNLKGNNLIKMRQIHANSP